MYSRGKKKKKKRKVSGYPWANKTTRGESLHSLGVRKKMGVHVSLHTPEVVNKHRSSHCMPKGQYKQVVNP